MDFSFNGFKKKKKPLDLTEEEKLEEAYRRAKEREEQFKEYLSVKQKIEIDESVKRWALRTPVDSKKLPLTKEGTLKKEYLKEEKEPEVTPALMQKFAEDLFLALFELRHTLTEAQFYDLMMAYENKLKKLGSHFHSGMLQDKIVDIRVRGEEPEEEDVF